MEKMECKYPKFRDWINRRLGDESHQWLADRTGKARSTITGYCGGNERPPKMVLARIINLFGENPLEIADFLYYDYEEIDELCQYLQITNSPVANFLKQAWSHLFNNRQSRENGLISDELNSIDYWIGLLDNRIESKMDTKTNIHELKKVSTHFHLERMACISAIATDRTQVPKEVAEDFSKIVKYSIDLGENLNDLYPFDSRQASFKALEGDYQIFYGLGQCHSWMAGAYFVARDFKQSVVFAKKALPHCSFDKNLLAETIRGLLLGLAHLKESEEFLRVEVFAQGLIESNSFEQMDMDLITCAFAEGRELLGKNGARGILKVVQEHLEDKKILTIYQPFKLVKIFKSLLLVGESEMKRGLNIDKDSLIAVADQGLLIAKKYKYSRHENEILALSLALSDKPLSVKDKIIQLQFGF